MIDIQDLAGRYVAVWNEVDPGARRKAVERLWAPDGVELRPDKEHRGYDELEQRVVGAYEQLVAGGGYAFHLDGPAHGHHEMVVFRTTMTPAAGGPVEWVGLMVLLLDDDGRIRRDYQFALTG